MFFKKKKELEDNDDIIKLTEAAKIDADKNILPETIEQKVEEKNLIEAEDKNKAADKQIEKKREKTSETKNANVSDIDKILSSLEAAFPPLPQENKEYETSKIDNINETIDEKDDEKGFAILDGKEAIYILGENALAVYLAIRFMNSGEKVILIPSKDNASSLSNNGVTLIENHNLQRNHYKFDTTFWLKETPKMLIITSEAAKINAAITSVSRKKVADIPIVLFTQMRDIEYIKNILGNDIYRAFFDGYLMQKPSQINLYGRAPSITLCLKGNEKRNNTVKEYFEKTGFVVNTNKDETKTFWEFFTVYTTCSLISAAYNKNIFDVIKDKDKRDKMIPLIAEICNLAKTDGGKVDQEEILKKIYNTPLSYPYPLQVDLAQGKAGDIDMISSNLINTARKYKIETSEISILLKKIYNIIIV